MRSKHRDSRTIFIKGERSKVKLLEDVQLALPAGFVIPLVEVIFEELSKRVKDVEEKEIYIHPQLYKTPYPIAMRDSSNTITSVIKGTRMPMPSTPIIRGFVHWQDDYGNMDIDLSLSLLTEDLTLGSTCSYTTLKSDTLQVYHSGDVRHKVGSNAEYIDFSVDRCVTAGYRYAVFQVYDFDGIGFANQENPITFGWLGIHSNEEKIFDPKHIENAIRIVGKDSTSIVVAMDLQTMECIWLDINTNNSSSLNNLESNQGKTKNFLQAAINLLDTHLTIGEFLEAIYVRGKGLSTAPEGDVGVLCFDSNVDYTEIANICA
jgi:hypothetical protein